jgi:hypothetical protein
VGESFDEERLRIESERLAKLGAESWRLIAARLRAIDGDGWHGGQDPELEQVIEGPDPGRVFWKVGDRQLEVDGELVIETAIVAGRPTRRRVIGPGGVVRDDEIITPDLN